MPKLVVSTLLTGLGLLTLNLQESYVHAAPCVPDPNQYLCGDLTTVVPIRNDCKTQNITLDPIEPCCPMNPVPKPANVCPLPPNSEPKCRYVELSHGACLTADECRAMVLRMSIEKTIQPDKCCETCACYGDPHCESFAGIIDTWVLCDARTKKKGVSGCPITESQCVLERDHNGNPCFWRPNIPGVKWNTGLMGSQCIFDMENQELPGLQMYKADDFEIFLKLGERGIISHASIDSNGGTFTMTSEACFEEYFKAANGEDPNATPWRNDDGSAPLDPSWLPRTWPFTMLPGGDILWSVIGLKSGINVNIRCTRTVGKVNGQLRYGPPRLNIEEVIEPVSRNLRKNVAGFCVTNKIDTMKATTENSLAMLEKGCHVEGNSELEIAKILCSKGISDAGLAACRENYCKAARVNWEECVLEIGRFGWERVWCAANTLESKNPVLCTLGVCRQCVSDIADFGWLSAIERWKDYYKGTGISEGDCLKLDELPTDITSCQRGLTLQYEESPGVWKNYKSIPATAEICNGRLEFDSNSHPLLFVKKIRIKQCALSRECLADSCDPEIGFKANLQFISEESIAEDLVELVDNGDLICNPDKYPNDPKGCLKINPPDMCTCPDA